MRARTLHSDLTLALTLAFTMAGCGGGCSGPPDEPSPAAATPRTEASGGEAHHREPAAEPVDPGEPPVLRVAGAVDDHDGQVAIRVENHGTDTAELRGALTLQRRNGDEWEDARAQLDLRYACEDEAAECVTLAPGAVFIPPPWLGTLGDSQCECDGCERAPAGTYRVVITSCNGAHTVPGEPFELPAR